MNKSIEEILSELEVLSPDDMMAEAINIIVTAPDFSVDGKILLQKVIESGASLDLSIPEPRMETGYGETSPLCELINHGDRGLIEFLLEAGADPNFTPRNFLPPLILAIRKDEDFDTINALIQAGASLSECDDSHDYPIFEIWNILLDFYRWNDAGVEFLDESLLEYMQVFHKAGANLGASSCYMNENLEDICRSFGLEESLEFLNSIR